MIIKTNTNKFYFILDVLKPFVKSFDVPQERAIDIDTAFDFKVAELLFKSARS
jgi:CMP-N-acetylneuraminic acid synthetase